jgi:hypothetical protein
MKHIAMVMVSEPTNMWMYDVWFQKLAMILLATAQNHIGISSSEIATDTKDFDYVCPSWSMCGLQDRFLLVYFYRFTWLGMVATVTSTYIGLPWFTSIITPPIWVYLKRWHEPSDHHGMTRPSVAIAWTCKRQSHSFAAFIAGSRETPRLRWAADMNLKWGFSKGSNGIIIHLIHGIYSLVI